MWFESISYFIFSEPGWWNSAILAELDELRLRWLIAMVTTEARPTRAAPLFYSATTTTRPSRYPTVL